MTNAQALKLIRAVEEADSSARLVSTVWELANARLEAAIPTLITILGYNNPGAAVAAVEGLIQLGDVAVQPLLEQLDGYNYGARAWAVRALAGIGDPRGLETLLNAVQTDFAMSVRRAAAKGLGNLRWHQLPADQITSAQAQALDALTSVTQDPEWVVRYATVVALQSLAIAAWETQPDWRSPILEVLHRMAETDESLAVRARTWLAIQHLEKALHSTTSSHGSTSQEAGDLDWRSTLEKLYNRKAQERSLQEGDPRKFREVALAIVAEPPSAP